MKTIKIELTEEELINLYRHFSDNFSYGYEGTYGAYEDNFEGERAVSERVIHKLEVVLNKQSDRFEV